MMWELLSLLGLIALILAFLPRERIASFLGESKGLLASLNGAIIGSITILPGVIAFPLANQLNLSGASLSAVAAFITILTMVGLATSPMEISYFGVKYTVLRNSFSFVFALKKKGASVRNLTILISTWAVIKIPMLFMELKSLGPRFTLLRYVLTLPTLFILGFLMDRLIKMEEMTGEKEISHESVTLSVLPGKDCGGCGYKTCSQLFLTEKNDKDKMLEKYIFLKE